MSYPDQPGGPYPPRDMREPNESQYPPPPGEEDDRARAYHPRAPSTSGITLPPMSQSISPYDQQYGPPAGYQHDPRYRPDPYQNTQPVVYGRDDRGYQGDYGRGPQPMAFQQSAPRQRTAIACRYCRRRKIRCSGFEQSADGRCSNCQRFQQECIFTPVSSQTQAFVPAHAVYPYMRNMGISADGRTRPMIYPQGGQQVYGAHGQPLGQVPPPQVGGSPYSEYHVPSPTGSYNSFTEERSDSGRKRQHTEAHPAILPPPVPGQPAYREDGSSRRPPAQDDLRLPPVTPTLGTQAPSSYSPGSSASPAPGLRLPPDSGPKSSRTPPPRTSPGERADPMSLGNIMEHGPSTDIDQNMLGRLNRGN